jgi:hypothetical protein
MQIEKPMRVSQFNQAAGFKLVRRCHGTVMQQYDNPPTRRACRAGIVTGSAPAGNLPRAEVCHSDPFLTFLARVT